MKKMLLFLACVFCLNTLMAQDVNVPATIRTNFAKSYPQAAEVEWIFDGEYYAVAFKNKNNLDQSVVYTPQGKVLEVEEQITDAQIPAAVKKSASEYGKPGMAMMLTKEDGQKEYFLEIDAEFYHFDANGKLLEEDGDNDAVDID